MKKMWRLFLCLIGDHDWTNKAEQEIPPTRLEHKLGVVGFKKYATMYCKHCGQISEFS